MVYLSTPLKDNLSQTTFKRSGYNLNSKSAKTKEKKQDSLQNILSSLETTVQVRPEVETYISTLSKRLLKLTRDYYATFIFILTTNLSLHQRLILMYLITVYPKECSATELAKRIGISVQSKSIYRDLKLLKQVDFICFNEIHSRLKLVHANNENNMIARMIELAYVQGELQNEFSFTDPSRKEEKC